MEDILHVVELTLIQWSILTAVQVGQQVLHLQTTQVTCTVCIYGRQSEEEFMKPNKINYLNVPIIMVCAKSSMFAADRHIFYRHCFHACTR